MCSNGYLVAEGHGGGTRYYLSRLDANPISNPISNLISKTRKKRMSQYEIREAIIGICSDWVSLDYLSKKLEKRSIEEKINNDARRTMEHTFSRGD